MVPTILTLNLSAVSTMFRWKRMCGTLEINPLPKLSMAISTVMESRTSLILTTITTEHQTQPILMMTTMAYSTCTMSTTIMMEYGMNACNSIQTRMAKAIIQIPSISKLLGVIVRLITTGTRTMIDFVQSIWITIWYGIGWIQTWEHLNSMSSTTRMALLGTIRMTNPTI